MKAVINEKETPVKSEYPCLKISTNTGNIILFTDNTHGTVVFLGDGNKNVYSLAERSLFDPEMFTPFTGSITLSND